MASVPNLPIAPAIPTPGAPGTPDADGAAIDLFAQLLGGGPPIAVVAGPGTTSADVVTLRAAPSGDEGESVDGAPAPDGATSADIIPLLQAQSGFPVAVVPAAPPAAAATTESRLTGPVPTDVMPAAPDQTEAELPARVRVAAVSAPKFVSIPQVSRLAVQAAPDAQQAITPESDAVPEAGIVGVAVEAAIERMVCKPVVRAGKPGRAAHAASPEGKAVESVVVASAQARPAEPVARIEAVVQPAAPGSPTISTVPIAPQPATPIAAPAPAANAAPAIAELIVERQLDLANDNQWLDRLARDIARSGAGDEPLRFRLHPQTLGHLQVELSQSDRGATVRLTVETEAARNILIDAQPRLAAEARAQGVRLAGTEVDLGTAHQQSGDPRRNADNHAQGVVRVVRATQSQTTSSDPASGRSDRYA